MVIQEAIVQHLASLLWVAAVVDLAFILALLADQVVVLPSKMADQVVLPQDQAMPATGIA